MNTSVLSAVCQPRSQFVLLLFCAALYLGINNLPGQTNKGMTYEETIKKSYVEKWNLLLTQFKQGDSLEEVKKALPVQVKLIGFRTLGGSGQREWIFRIDDVSDLVIFTDRHDRLAVAPSLQPKGIWCIFPDGTIQSSS